MFAGLPTMLFKWTPYRVDQQHCFCLIVSSKKIQSCRCHTWARQSQVVQSPLLLHFVWVSVVHVLKISCICRPSGNGVYCTCIQMCCTVQSSVNRHSAPACALLTILSASHGAILYIMMSILLLFGVSCPSVSPSCLWPGEGGLRLLFVYPCLGKEHAGK